MKFDSLDIIKAMQIIADSSNSKLKLDKTITAQIDSIENVETGEYRVKYEGNTFPAFSYDVKITFKVGENVYVKIPENDMSKRKIIEGRISSIGSTLTDILEQQVEINLIEPSLDKFYGYDRDKTYGLVAGVSIEHPYFMQTIFKAPQNTIGDHYFQNYAKNYNKIRISGSFYTNFIGQHNKGNYGLIVTFKTLNGDPISYRLDFSSFVGNPYRYTQPSPQSVIIDVFEQSILGLDSILLFQESFETDKSLNYNQQIIYENKGEDDPPVCNIFVKDIDISFCEVIDLKDTTYYLTIATPLGSIFSGTTTSLSLDARLKFQGKNILAENSCKCYWYQENLEIKKGSDKFDKLAGVRWEKINLDTQDYLSSITVKSEEVKSHAKYKLVVIYKDVTLSKEIQISQYDPNHDIKIKQSTRNSSRIILEIVSKKNNDNRVYSGDWYFLLPDGSYDLIPEGEKVSSVDVTDYLLYPTATFYCQVYYNNEPISIESHSFNISDSQDDLTLTYVGQDIYQYDANGDIAYEDTELDRTLGIEVTWKEGFGSNYTVSYLAPDGTELQSDRIKAYSPSNSMMQNLWVDSTSILHYNINQKYNLSYNNNIITIKIKCTANGNEYTFYKEILFLKDGDQGTNGTTYICAIRPVNLNNGFKLNGFHALNYNGGWQGSGLNLRCYVYKNGQLINNESDFTLTFKWECGSQTAARVDKLRISKITGFTNQDDYRNIQGVGTLDTVGDYVLKVTVNVREASNSEDTQIYCQYPIDIAVGGFDTAYLEMNLPSYVKYTASGINAAFLNQELKCKYRGNDLEIKPTNPSILNVKQGKLDPVQKFSYSGGIAALRCEVTSTTYLLHPVMMYLDTYGNEAINGWDGTKLEIDENGKYILAPQIGAGKKETDNTFTGVVMGRDTAEDKIGLYGYRHGIAQFGFKEDGTAFIGAAGRGQILFNGNKGTITSGNYSSSAGMMIDLSNGHIDAYNFKISSGNMLLDSANQKFEFQVGTSSNSRFLIKHADGQNLFYVGKDNYYLQSKNFVQNSAGTRIDLANGRINSWNFIIQTSNMILDSSTQKFDFKVGTANGSRFQIAVGSKNVFYVGPSSYYLQSVDYDRSSKGTRIDLANGRVISYNFRMSTPTIDLDSENNRFSISVGNKGYFRVKDGSDHTLLSAAANNYYLKSANYSYNSSTKEVTGTYIDLQNGTFHAGSNAIFSGSITAKSGTIGGWRITSNGLFYGGAGNDAQYEASATFRLSTSGTGSLYIGQAGTSDTRTYMSYSNGNLVVSGNIHAKDISLVDGNNRYSILSRNADSGKQSISGSYINCRGLSVTDGRQTTFAVDQFGNVTIRGSIHMGPNSTISWSQINTWDAPFATSEDLQYLDQELSRDIRDAIKAAEDANLSAEKAASLGEAIGGALGHVTQIGGNYVFSPVIMGDYIEGGTIKASVNLESSHQIIIGNGIIEAGAGWIGSGISIDGADILYLKGDSVEIYSRSGDVTIQGYDIASTLRDLENRVNNLERA